MSNSVANPIKTLRGDQRKVQMNVLRESVAQSDFIRKPINSNWSAMHSRKINFSFYSIPVATKQQNSTCAHGFKQ